MYEDDSTIQVRVHSSHYIPCVYFMSSQISCILFWCQGINLNLDVVAYSII